MRLAVLAIAGVLLASLTTTSAGAQPLKAGFSARIKPPPDVQVAGLTYYVTIIVRTRSRAVPNLCIDFEDDNNSWLVKVPGLRAFDDDVFCFGRVAAHVKKKQFIAKIIPARPGSRHLQVGIGNATVYRATNDAILDADSLWWSDRFVIVG